MSTQTATKPGFSNGTRDLLERLDNIAAAQADPHNEESVDSLWTTHVRGVLSPEGRPLFTEDALKLAFIELIAAAKPG